MGRLHYLLSICSDDYIENYQVNFKHQQIKKEKSKKTKFTYNLRIK